MELSNSVTTLFKSPLAGVSQPQRDIVAIENAPAAARGGAGSFAPAQFSHVEAMMQRLSKMMSALSKLQMSSPMLNDAPSLVVESNRNDNGASGYGAAGDTITDVFALRIQYKPDGNATYEVFSSSSATGDAEAAPSSDEAAPAAAAEVPAEAAPAPASDVRVAQLVEYYRFETAPAATSAPQAPAAPEAPVAPETPEAPAAPENDGGEEAPVVADDPGGDIVSINAAQAARIYTGAGDDQISITADSARRIGSGAGDDAVSIDADRAARVRTGAGDDELTINADAARRVRTGAGDDVVNITADRVARVNTGGGDDTLNINADSVRRINTGAGDDALTIEADAVTRVNTGDGDDTISINANTVRRFDAGAGDDTITLNADDAAIAFGKGGGEDVIDIAGVGALAIQIDGALASSSEEVNIIRDGSSATLEFSSGEKLTLNNLENAGAVSVRIGGDTVDLHMSEPPAALDLTA